MLSIKVENLGKRYRIGLKEEQHESLFNLFLAFLKSPIKNYKTYRSLYSFSETSGSKAFIDDEKNGIIWPLKGLNFEVNKGEVVGIIGKNGAGKSTLLKVLSRITHPTTGRVEAFGSISSLLEVGTGFHPELTGRENIYLNGAILGMRKKEIDNKLDQIINFSGVHKFIDTPVKRYSSGMKVRLAFSVAAHLEPDILIIDEVLAVGDAEFQKKCLNKMEDAGKQGRTVLFVSHNMPAVTRLCPRAIFLENGKIVDDGPSQKVVANYLSKDSGTTAERIWKNTLNAPGSDIARLRGLRVMSKSGQVTESIDIREPFSIDMEYEILKSGSILLPHHHFFNGEGIHVFTTLDTDPQWRLKPRPKGSVKSTVWIPGNLLSEGNYMVGSGMITLNPEIPQFYENPAISFTVIDTIEGDSARGDFTKNIDGVVRPLLKWNNQYH